MTVEQWRRISAVFAAAQALGDPERGVFLDAACARHPEDRPEIESLLERHDASDEFPAALAPEAGPAADGSLAAAREPFAIGQQVGNYRIVRRLKPGGMGVLFVAEDNLWREVVIKVLAPAWAADPRQRTRLRHEAEAMARLQHPGIAAVYAFEELGDVSYLVSEFVRGRDLRERLTDDGPFDPPSLVALALAITEALAAAHRAGIIHRDLKPENIMLPDAGGVKLVDFGIARVELTDQPTRTNLTGTGALIGTPAYMTPEQLQGLRVDARSDLFALGIVLYEAGTGLHPFAGRTRATTMMNILQLEPAPLGSRRPVPFGLLEPIIARCLRKTPDDRYRSADELLAQLHQAERPSSGGLFAGIGGVGRADTPAVAWWRFHQLAVSVFYGLCLIPTWILREQLSPGATRDLLFFGVLAAAVVSILVRLNAAFLARHSPPALAAVRRRVRLGLIAIDLLFSAVLLFGAMAARPSKPGLAAALLTGALGALVTLLVIEPATARAAFGDASSEEGNG